MRDRDEALRDAGELVLWFERDLYDQLQLLQVLDRLGRRPAALVDLGRAGGLARPRCRAETRLIRAGKLGRTAWAAFRSSDPTAVEAVIAAGPAGLPFLGAALIRHLEQFPAVDDGLSRTERTILEAVAAGSRTRAEVFAASGRARGAAVHGRQRGLAPSRPSSRRARAAADRRGRRRRADGGRGGRSGGTARRGATERDRPLARRRSPPGRDAWRWDAAWRSATGAASRSRAR